MDGGAGWGHWSCCSLDEAGPGGCSRARQAPGLHKHHVGVRVNTGPAAAMLKPESLQHFYRQALAELVAVAPGRSLQLPSTAGMEARLEMHLTFVGFAVLLFFFFIIKEKQPISHLPAQVQPVPCSVPATWTGSCRINLFPLWCKESPGAACCAGWGGQQCSCPPDLLSLLSTQGRGFFTGRKVGSSKPSPGSSRRLV